MVGDIDKPKHGQTESKIAENKQRLTCYTCQRKILAFYTRHPRSQLGDCG